MGLVEIVMGRDAVSLRFVACSSYVFLSVKADFLPSPRYLSEHMQMPLEWLICPF